MSNHPPVGDWYAAIQNKIVPEGPGDYRLDGPRKNRRYFGLVAFAVVIVVSYRHFITRPRVVIQHIATGDILTVRIDYREGLAAGTQSST
ncbi:MAG: hypothetical protein WDM88_09120 [Galbitalea sp.]